MESHHSLEMRRWAIVVSLLVSMIFVCGPAFGTDAVFFTPLLEQFRLSRAQLSLMGSFLFAASGLGAPVVGWLLDRIEAMYVMVVGTLIFALGLWINSRADGLEALIIGHILMGFGACASTIIPSSYVVSHWFGDNRGTAMGIVISGLALGPMAMTLISSYLVSTIGWSETYLVLEVPVLAVALPAQIFLIRGRPPGGVKKVVGPALDTPGLEVESALRVPSFWLIAVTLFTFGLATTALSLHIIPYLIKSGYKPASAALAMSVVFASASFGNVAMGWFSDRVTPRLALAAAMAVISLAVMFLFSSFAVVGLAAFVVIYGFAHQSGSVLPPLVIAETMGLKRFGSIYGLLALATTVGGFLGPVVTGQMFDLSGSYSAAWVLISALLLVGAAAPLACTPLLVSVERAVGV